MCAHECNYRQAHATRIYSCVCVSVCICMPWLFLNEASVPLSHPYLLSDARPYNYCELAHMQPILIKVKK